MSTLRRTVRLSACVLSTLVSAGCLQPRPVPDLPTTPPITAPSPIQLRVVVHLADLILGPDDVIGDRTNIGCRLTLSEMQAYLEELRAFAKQSFGVGVEVSWNWPPEEFKDEYLGFTGRDLFDGMRITTFRDRVGADPNFDWGKINLYFTGWILPDSGPGNHFLASALDPTEADLIVKRPYIHVNDLDFDPPPPGAQPFFTPGYWILPHEFCHYLLRRGLGDPGNPEGEHWPPVTYWLMRGGGVMPLPHTLKPIEDTDRIRRRIELGLVYSPDLTDLDP